MFKKALGTHRLANFSPPRRTQKSPPHPAGCADANSLPPHRAKSLPHLVGCVDGAGCGDAVSDVDPSLLTYSEVGADRPPGAPGEEFF
jgi:hypothetical protein